MTSSVNKPTKEEILGFHSKSPKGKLEVTLAKPFSTVRDLSIAYSPGVALPCLEIAKDASLAYEYTSKGNFVAIISNGTAVLGLGDIGAMASKPVMEGKAALLKRFAGVDAIDVEVETKDVEEFITVVKNIGRTWGGINLEDIKAPECFEIETRLQELLDIPVFHDDQHGTAVVVLAGVINACLLTKRKIDEIKIVVNGAGAAAIACTELLKHYGVKHGNVTLCDSVGVVYKGRTNGMNKYKEKHAIETTARTLSDAIANADVFLGLSKKDELKPEMLLKMADNPIVFAMANPDPEITPDLAKATRSDVIIGTGRSDYPNQINNLLCFPYLFRGALDCRATKIIMEMKVAVSESLAEIARDVTIPSEVQKEYPDRSFAFGVDYIIPTPLDPRLAIIIPKKVVEIARKHGVARV